MGEYKRKAVILCGGEGSRLRPLTSTTPKPLLKVGGEAVVIRLLKMLKREGILSVALTLGYKGKEIEEYVTGRRDVIFGMEIVFCYEDTPLGSAGCLKNLEGFLDCNFMVICGDAWCDFDVVAPFELLEKNHCLGVILTSKSKNPLEYGLVLCDNDGMVRGFSEKPSWSGVSSRRVNTGIYIFKKEILSLIPYGKYDFGRDLFAKMLNEDLALCCHELKGSWCDMGDPLAFYRCNMMQTDNKGYYEDCYISPFAKVSASVILEGTRILEGSRICGAVIGEGCVIGENCVIKEGCVIGPHSKIAKNSLLHPGVFIDEGGVVNGEEIANPLHGLNLFMNRKMCFDLYVMTEVFCRALGKTLRSAVGKGKIGVMTDSFGMCREISSHLIDGLTFGGERCLFFNEGNKYLASFVSRKKGCELTVYISSEHGGREGISLEFFDKNGVYPGAVFESKVKHCAKWANDIPFLRQAEAIELCLEDEYINDMIKECDAPLSRIKLNYKGNSSVFYYLNGAKSKYPETAGEGNIELTACADFDGELDKIIYDGQSFEGYQILCIVILNYIKRGVTEIPLPHRAPEGVKDFVKKRGARLKNYSLCCHDLKEKAVASSFARLPALIDPCFALLSVASFIAAEGVTGRELKELLPEFEYVSWQGYLPEKLKESIIDEERWDGEGFYMRGQEKIRLVPENSHILSVYAEAADMEDARELIDIAKEYVDRLIRENIKNQE